MATPKRPRTVLSAEVLEDRLVPAHLATVEPPPPREDNPVPGLFAPLQDDHAQCDKPERFECGQHYLWWLQNHQHKQAKPTKLQRAVDRAQLDLADLKESLGEAGADWRQSFCDEVKRIGKALRKHFDKAPANDPGMNAAREGLQLLDVLERDCNDPAVIPDAATAANRVQEIIDRMEAAK